jgi:hypothetical protein
VLVRTLQPFYFHQWLDVCDTQQNWLEAQIIAIEFENGEIIRAKSNLPSHPFPCTPIKIYVHYKGWHAKYDEPFQIAPHMERVAVLHTHTNKKEQNCPSVIQSFIMTYLHLC